VVGSLGLLAAAPSFSLSSYICSVAGESAVKDCRYRFVNSIQRYRNRGGNISAPNAAFTSYNLWPNLRSSQMNAAKTLPQRGRFLNTIPIHNSQ
jgi:hypothetical protein